VADPAELGVERVAGARRRQQDDGGGFGVDGFAVFDQQDVVDAAALERDRAGDRRRFDRQARRLGERDVAGHRRGGGGRGLRRGGGAGARRYGRLLRRR